MKSTTLPDDLSGAAYLIELSHPEYSRAQLIKAARRALARQSRYTRAAGVSRAESVEHGDCIGFLADQTADTITQVETREDVARCLTGCNAIDQTITRAMLEQFAEGNLSAGQRRFEFSTRAVGAAVGLGKSTIANRVQAMRVQCLARK
jgi:hypothetical protein